VLWIRAAGPAIPKCLRRRKTTPQRHSRNRSLASWCPDAGRQDSKLTGKPLLRMDAPPPGLNVGRGRIGGRILVGQGRVLRHPIKVAGMTLRGPPTAHRGGGGYDGLPMRVPLGPMALKGAWV